MCVFSCVSFPFFFFLFFFSFFFFFLFSFFFLVSIFFSLLFFYFVAVLFSRACFDRESACDIESRSLCGFVVFGKGLGTILETLVRFFCRLVMLGFSLFF